MKLKDVERSILNIRTSIDNVRDSMEHQRDRANDQRDAIVRLQQRLDHLECDKHNYKYSGRKDINNMSRMYGGILAGFLLADYRYMFTCTKCKKEIEVKEKDLSASQRRGLVALGLIAKPVVKK
jgi:hypothetical protein